MPFSGNRLRHLRESRGLRPEQLAAESGLSFSGILGYEAGRRVPKLNSAERLAAALGVEVTELLEGER